MTRWRDEIDDIRRSLVLGGEAAARLANHLEDLRDQAFLRHVGDHEHVRGGADHPGVETTGDMRARRLWDDVLAARIMLDRMPVLERAIGDYFMAGRMPDPTPGSLINKGDFVSQIRRQRRRGEAGEHVPMKLVEQPPYPGTGR